MGRRVRRMGRDAPALAKSVVRRCSVPDRSQPWRWPNRATEPLDESPRGCQATAASLETEVRPADTLVRQEIRGAT
jgi:hypothetical protein